MTMPNFGKHRSGEDETVYYITRNQFLRLSKSTFDCSGELEALAKVWQAAIGIASCVPPHAQRASFAQSPPHPLSVHHCTLVHFCPLFHRGPLQGCAALCPHLPGAGGEVEHWQWWTKLDAVDTASHFSKHQTYSSLSHHMSNSSSSFYSS